MFLISGSLVACETQASQSPGSCLFRPRGQCSQKREAQTQCSRNAGSVLLRPHAVLTCQCVTDTMHAIPPLFFQRRREHLRVPVVLLALALVLALVLVLVLVPPSPSN